MATKTIRTGCIRYDAGESKGLIPCDHARRSVELAAIGGRWPVVVLFLIGTIITIVLVPVLYATLHHMPSPKVH